MVRSTLPFQKSLPSWFRARKFCKWAIEAWKRKFGAKNTIYRLKKKCWSFWVISSRFESFWVMLSQTESYWVVLSHSVFHTYSAWKVQPNLCLVRCCDVPNNGWESHLESPFKFLNTCNLGKGSPKLCWIYMYICIHIFLLSVTWFQSKCWAIAKKRTKIDVTRSDLFAADTFILGVAFAAWKVTKPATLNVSQNSVTCTD